MADYKNTVFLSGYLGQFMVMPVNQGSLSILWDQGPFFLEAGADNIVLVSRHWLHYQLSLMAPSQPKLQWKLLPLITAMHQK